MTTLNQDSYPTENHDAIALWDMDGTLVDYDLAMETAIASLRSPDETWEGRAHSVREPWMEARIKMIRSVPGFWRNLKPLKLGFDILEAAKPFDFENHVVTKGPTSANSAWSEKAAWCAEHLPDMHIHISQKKSLIYGKVLVDDWPGYFMPWLEVRPRGLVVAIKWPWNAEYSHPNLVHYDGTNINEVTDRLAEAHASVTRK